jgi:hypothetical protein
LSDYVVIAESSPEVVQVIETASEVVQVLEVAPEIVQVFSDLTINNIGSDLPEGGQKGQILRVSSDSPRVLAWVDSSADLIRPAAVTVSGHRAVYLAEDGFRYSSNDDLTTIGMCLGLTTGAAIAGSPVIVKSVGLISDPAWNFPRPGLIFLGQDGLLLMSPPIAPALFLQEVGKAISSTSMFVFVRPPIILGI